MNKEFNFSVTIIGAGSAMPAHNHISACQIVRYGKHYYQIDCSDGAFYRMIELGIPYQNIDAIFISHNHGDHINGLIECIEGFSLGGRTKPLKIFSPAGLEKLYKPMLDEFCTDLRYKFEFIELNSEEQKVIWEDNCLTVETIPLLHTVPCCGYLFKENKKLPHIDIDKINKFGIPVKFINSIKNGLDWIDKDGTIIKSEELTIPPDKPHSYAYCSDTTYFPELSNIIKNVNLVFHETSFKKDDDKQAHIFGHSTTYSAALTALDAKVDKLLIGHISARYKSENELLEEVKEVFENTEIAMDCLTYEI